MRNENDIRDYDVERNLAAWRFQRVNEVRRTGRWIRIAAFVAIGTVLSAWIGWRYL